MMIKKVISYFAFILFALKYRNNPVDYNSKKYEPFKYEGKHYLSYHDRINVLSLLNRTIQLIVIVLWLASIYYINQK